MSDDLEKVLKLSFPVVKPNPKQQEELKRQVAELSRRLLEETRREHDPYVMVRDFHKAMGQPVGDKIGFLGEERLEFRLKLIEEEYNELLEALDEGDIANAFKEMADLIYVIEGLAVEMGGDLGEVFKAVHRSNMSKLGPDGKPVYREDGKVKKGDNYEPPDIQDVLF